uniref:Metalloendopeptidase n=1 Tax=Acrobeloides nanus TaxID=290746 RepID=A0A914EJT7_9BILA
MSRLNLVLILVVLCISWEAYVQAAKGGNGHEREEHGNGKHRGHDKNLWDIPDELSTTVKKVKKHIGKLSKEAKDRVLGICKRRNCKEVPEEVKQRKKGILKREFEFRKKFNPSLTMEEVEGHFNAMHRVKQKLLEISGLLNDVTPHDDGTFGHDQLLTETQANNLVDNLDALLKETTEELEELANETLSQVSGTLGSATGTLTETLEETSGTATGTLGGVTGSVTGLLGKRKKRNSLYFEENFAAHWDIGQPIPYAFDTTLSPTEQGMINSALQQISSVSCVRFQFLAKAPSTPHLFYTKFASAGFCGLSYIGKVTPANPIYLSFSCPDFTGVVMHETFHALGVNHHHIRADRDNFITINWDNVNPQQYDYFAVADSKQFTSYGITYDYGSIMHYNSYVAGANPSVQTMIPKFNPSQAVPLMGQRKALRQGDILLLNKMYCKPAACKDANIYCGAWALQNLCGPNQWVTQNCVKSCGGC